MLGRNMNLALWKKAVSDAWLTLAVSSVLLILFCWLFVWLMSLFDIGAWSRLLDLLPEDGLAISRFWTFFNRRN